MVRETKQLHAMNKYASFCLSLLVFVFSSCNRNHEIPKNTESGKIPNSILIVYSSGQPYKTISDIKAGEVDAASGATPVDMNVEIIARKLYANIKGNYTVRLAKANEIKSYKEILQYNMMIMGCPTYFWNIQWEMKQMIDIHFEKIYIAKQDEFKKMKHIAFAMGENKTCVENAIDKFKSAITDCSAKLDASQAFITKQSQTEYDEQISHLAFIVDSVMQAH